MDCCVSILYMYVCMYAVKCRCHGKINEKKPLMTDHKFEAYLIRKCVRLVAYSLAMPIHITRIYVVSVIHGTVC